MKIAGFVYIFSRRDDVAIEPETDVRNALLEFGCKDEVLFLPDPKMNPGIIRGSIEHYERMVDNERVRGARITYAAQMPHDWQRLVCCKELLHILDPDDARISGHEDIDHLASKIVLPPELQDPTDGYGVITDRIMVAFAIAVLFPMGARALYQKMLDASAITLADIAEDVGIPFTYVELVMSPIWPEYHDKLCSLRT